MIFVGPALLSGIGQHLNKYRSLFPDTQYYMIGDKNIPDCDHAFLFAIPTDYIFEYIPFLKSKAKRVSCMTVCETETVHEDYGKLFELFDEILVPSNFCQTVLSRQFPETIFKIVHAHIPPPPEIYTFYHIGNILDNRKNFKYILEAFIRLQLPNSRLVVKATCNQDVKINLPNVKVINGLISNEEMEDVHKISDCYVSFSSSEGVGMGAVEACMHDKPVIITDYGGASEYIKTPYLIDCGLQEISEDDFLFKKGMIWGKPNFEQLMKYMSDAYNKKMKFMNHDYTKKMVGNDNILEEFFINVIGGKNNETD
jgi:glycosyltransferase involved in cell wall biosynthesis